MLADLASEHSSRDGDSLARQSSPCQTVAVKTLDSATLLDIDEIELGCRFLGSGGGGSTRTFREYLRYNNSAVDSVAIQQWTDQSRACAVGIVGPTEVVDEALPSGLELASAYESLAHVSSYSFNSVMPWQIGGVCTLTAIATSALLDLPLVDADLVGRAASSLEQVACFDPFSPLNAALASSTGERLSIRTRDLAHLERTVRQMLGFGCGWMVLAITPASAPFQTTDVVHGQVSVARNIGHEMMQAGHTLKGRHGLGHVGVSILGEGRITENTHYGVKDPQSRIAGQGSRNVRSFTLRDQCSGTVLRVEATNEFLLVLVDGELVVAAPDIISLQDVHTGLLCSPQDVRHGMVVRVMSSRYPYDRITGKRDVERLQLSAYGLAARE